MPASMHMLTGTERARGGRTRAANLSPARRSQIARVAARARWRTVPVTSSGPLVTPAFEIDPTQIRLTAIPSRDLVALQKRMSRATWRPYGRRLAFMIEHEGARLGIVLLAEPGNQPRRP